VNRDEVDALIASTLDDRGVEWERTEALSRDELMKLHGTIRELG